MRRHEIVLDTNVIVSGLRSRRGASYRILTLVGSERFGLNLSVPLVIEYEDVLLRPESAVPLPPGEILEVLDHLCSAARHHKIFFLWRPLLKHPKDDMVLEIAVKSASRRIVTSNRKDYTGCERFGISVVTPGEFLRSIGALQ
jgi:putative PIN family toxin of toxin-antitoxin system